MTTLIQAIALVIAIVIIVLVAKWQVDDDIKKMEKRHDEFRKKMNNKKITMNKDITSIILRRAGFNIKENCFTFCPYSYTMKLPNVNIEVVHYIHEIPTRSWNVMISELGGLLIADIYIQTIDHFNKLMELMDIDFRLKEE